MQYSNAAKLRTQGKLHWLLGWSPPRFKQKKHDWRIWPEKLQIHCKGFAQEKTWNSFPATSNHNSSSPRTYLQFWRWLVICWILQNLVFCMLLLASCIVADLCSLLQEIKCQDDMHHRIWCLARENCMWYMKCLTSWTLECDVYCDFTEEATSSRFHSHRC